MFKADVSQNKPNKLFPSKGMSYPKRYFLYWVKIGYFKK